MGHVVVNDGIGSLKWKSLNYCFSYEHLGQKLKSLVHTWAVSVTHWSEISINISTRMFLFSFAYASAYFTCVMLIAQVWTRLKGGFDRSCCHHSNLSCKELDRDLFRDFGQLASTEIQSQDWSIKVKVLKQWKLLRATSRSRIIRKKSTKAIINT